jgi:putative pyruvate formate lyase activating enzyme
MIDRDFHSDKGMIHALGRYVSILEKKEKARYLVCKHIAVERSDDLKKMWRIHDDAVSDFSRSRQTQPEYSLLDLKADIADKLVENCVLCERRCGRNRKAGEMGWCRVGYPARVSCAYAHFGEEPELVPSGTIFFCGCNFRCVYCQNWNISQYPDHGNIWEPARIAKWIENYEAVNVNLVGGEPTPNLHRILGALQLCNASRPIMWNSNMYMSEEAMKLLDGVVDVYLGDLRYGNNDCAKKLSNVTNYWETATRNFLKAKRNSEILVRVLVLPGHVECCDKPIVKWVADNLGNDVRTNIMSQYRPEHDAESYPPLNRRLVPDEYRSVSNYAKELGLWNLELQGL